MEGLKYFPVFLLSFILCVQTAFAQSDEENIQIVAAIKDYHECNSLCFEKALVSDDRDILLILHLYTKREFKSFCTARDPSMPDWSRYYSKIRMLKHDTAWSHVIKLWANNLETYNPNCLGYKLSIAKPITLSSEYDKLVIATAFKYDAEAMQFEAFVYFYNVKNINGKWMVCGSDDVLELLDDWKRKGKY